MAGGKRETVSIYNKSTYGQRLTLYNGKKLEPGKTARVPLKWGTRVIERVPYIVRAERGDSMAD